MGEVVNLRRIRKRKVRAREEESASVNRALFGQTKAARETSEREQARAAERLDQHRLERDEPDGGAP